VVAGGEAVCDELVLIVEDDPSIAELVQFVILDELGVRSVVAEDGERGLELARKLRPPLVLLDINLPKLSGLDVARQLKADPSTRALVLVAMTSASEVETRNAGCSDYLAKPFELDELINLAGRYVGTTAAALYQMSAADSLARPDQSPADAASPSTQHRSQPAPVHHNAKSAQSHPRRESARPAKIDKPPRRQAA
jgi:two-component system cell cycle response regulator DivK